MRPSFYHPIGLGRWWHTWRFPPSPPAPALPSLLNLARSIVDYLRVVDGPQTWPWWSCHSPSRASCLTSPNSSRARMTWFPFSLSALQLLTRPSSHRTRRMLLLLLRGPKPVNLLLDMSTLRLGTEDPVLLPLVLLMALTLGLGGHATHPQGPC